MFIDYILQVILAIFLLLILTAIAFFVYNYENLVIIRNSSTLKREIIIFDGIVDYSMTQTVFNTYNKGLFSYKDLTPSVNQNGGAEYSYNFWLYLDKTALKNNVSQSTSDIVLLLRGSKIKVPYVNDGNCELANNGKYILVKNPLIRIKADGSALIVEYNTITNPDAFRESGSSIISCNSSSWHDQNKGLLGIYNMDSYVYDKKWVMVSVVLREITPENDILYKNRTSCKIYVNGINALDRIVESPYNGTLEGSAAMKHNKAPLYINPGDIYNDSSDSNDSNPIKPSTDGEKGLLMANLSYFNYAIDELEIKTLFGKGFTKQTATMPMDDISIEDKYAIAPVMEEGVNFPIGF